MAVGRQGAGTGHLGALGGAQAPPPNGFIYLLGADGAFLKGADGLYLLGVAP